jgi:hypothetical protein
MIKTVGLLQEEDDTKIKIIDKKDAYLKKNISKLKKFKIKDKVIISLIKRCQNMDGDYTIISFYSGYLEASKITNGKVSDGIVKIYYNTITNIENKNKKGGKRRTKKNPKKTAKKQKKSAKKTKRHR